jgi:hypothetical protein
MPVNWLVYHLPIALGSGGGQSLPFRGRIDQPPRWPASLLQYPIKFVRQAEAAAGRLA